MLLKIFLDVYALEIPKPRNLHLAKGQIIFEDVRPRPLIDKQPIQSNINFGCISTRKFKLKMYNSGLVSLAWIGAMNGCGGRRGVVC